MSATAFPFLRLPLLAQLEVVKHLRIAELMWFFHLSRKTARICEEYRYPVKKLEILLTEGRVQVTVYASKQPWQMASLQPFSSGAGDHLELFLKGTHGLWMFSARALDRYFEIGYPDEEDFTNVCNRFLDTVFRMYRRPEDVRLKVSPSLLRLDIWRRLRTPTQLFVSSIEDHQILSVDDAKFVMETMQVRDSLEIEAIVRHDYEFGEGFRTRRVKIPFSTWVRLDAVINSTSDRIKLKFFPIPTGAQLNNLLKLWIAKEKMVDLEILHIEISAHFSMNIEEEALEGIEYQEAECASFVEIRRCDGWVAGVRICLQKFVFRRLGFQKGIF